MTLSEPRPESLPDVDTLLRTTLQDDLPTGTEARLNESVERFLIEHRRGRRGFLTSAVNRVASAVVTIGSRPAGRVLRAAASAALVVCGFALHAVGGPGVFADSVFRVNESMALWTALRHAPSMNCTSGAAGDFGSPADLADRLYRRWVLADSVVDLAGASAALTFRSPTERALYTLVVDRHSLLPRRIVKRWLPGAVSPDGQTAGYDAGCTWGTPAGGTGFGADETSVPRITKEANR